MWHVQTSRDRKAPDELSWSGHIDFTQHFVVGLSWLQNYEAFHWFKGKEVGWDL